MRYSDIRKVHQTTYREYLKKLDELKNKDYPCPLNLTKSEMDSLESSVPSSLLHKFLRSLELYLKTNDKESKVYLDSLLDPILVDIRDKQYQEKERISQWRRRSAAGGHYSGSKYFTKVLKKIPPKRKINRFNELKTTDQTVREEFLWLKDKYLTSTSQRGNN